MAEDVGAEDFGQGRLIGIAGGGSVLRLRDIADPREFVGRPGHGMREAGQDRPDRDGPV